MLGKLEKKWRRMTAVQLHTYKINSMGDGILGKFYGWLVYIYFFLILWVIEFYLNLILLVVPKKSNLYLWVVGVKKSAILGGGAYFFLEQPLSDFLKKKKKIRYNI